MSASTLLPSERPAATASVVFIIGPWAAKWFSTRSAEQDQARWIVAPEAEAVQENLKKLRLKHRGIRVYAFFPFFPDAEEKAAQTLAQIEKWQRQFRQAEPLPCVLGLYARLSHESVAGEARWSGKLDLSNLNETTLAGELENLLAMPEPLSIHSLHRYAMMDVLRLWLMETGIAHSLHSLFSASSLRLTAVLLADSGNGFPRHGAWAQWLQQKFGLWPGLSPTALLPALPVTTAHSVAARPVRKKRLRWLPALFTLLLALCMVGSTWTEARYLTVASHHLDAFQQTDARQLQKKWALYQTLQKQEKQLMHCHDAWFSQLWRFSHCRKMAVRVSQTLQSYDLSPVFKPSDSVALFEQGSATLRPGSSEGLAALLPLIRDNAQTHFMIVGHSDNTGSFETNFQLSVRRARAVRDWLVSHANVPPSRFSIRGMGASRPIASNETAEGREKNRRVEMIPLPDTVQLQTGKSL